MDGRVQDSNLELLVWSPVPDEDDVVVLPMDDRPVSPPRVLSLVIASCCAQYQFSECAARVCVFRQARTRKEGRMVGS